jgi:hypothetical protein
LQTFLPYPNIKLSLKTLDNKRLGKQRVESKVIIDLLLGRKNNRWINHPAVKMWKNHEELLKYYYNLSIDEWIKRGFNNNMEKEKCKNLVDIKTPAWFGYYKLHKSHKCNLLRKNFKYYSEFWPNEDINAPYWWPVELKDKKKQKLIDLYWNKELINV